MTIPNYILLDFARMSNHIDEAINLNPRFDSLYRGPSQQTLAAIAPYLFYYQNGTGFSNWYQENGWGNAWGVLFSTNSPFEECHKHFRKFLLVKTEFGRELYFRFYDPRVLRVFLPSCNREQVKEFFGPIHCFMVESENKELVLVYSHEHGVLKQKELPVADVFHQQILIP